MRVFVVVLRSDKHTGLKTLEFVPRYCFLSKCFFNCLNRLAEFESWMTGVEGLVDTLGEEETLSSSDYKKSLAKFQVCIDLFLFLCDELPMFLTFPFHPIDHQFI